MSPVHASLVVQSSQALPEVVPSAKECPIFPGETDTIKDAHLLLFKDKENTNKASMVKVRKVAVFCLYSIRFVRLIRTF